MSQNTISPFNITISVNETGALNIATEANDPLQVIGVLTSAVKLYTDNIYKLNNEQPTK